jgi:glycosyltransferase involved in cell wall biosynthesis
MNQGRDVQTLRLCIITPSPPGYSETFIRAHIEHLPVELDLLTGQSTMLFDSDGRPLLSGPVRLGLRVVAAITRIPETKWTQAAFHYASRSIRARGLRQWLRRHPVDVVLVEYGTKGASVFDLLPPDLPLVVHFHGYDAYKQDVLDRYGNVYPRMFQRANRLIAVSRDMEGQLGRLGAPVEKIVYIPYGIDTEKFAESRPAFAQPLFISVGRFTQKKAPYMTLLAFSKVCKQVSDARLIMVGDGELLEVCRRMAAALGLSDRVELPGALPHEEVAKYMRQARCYVQHSLRADSGDSEGTPLSITEASASGLPVVSTRHAGIKDVIVEDTTGFLVDEGDTEAMAAHMTRLARDPALAARLGAAGRERVQEEFSLNGSIGKLFRLLQDTCAARQGGGV